MIFSRYMDTRGKIAKMSCIMLGDVREREREKEREEGGEGYYVHVWNEP